MEPSSFDASLARIRKGSDAARYAQLVPFSDMSSEELTRFKEVWGGMDADSQYKLLSRMVALAEEKVDVNFDRVMELCLSSPDDRLKVKAIEGLWENREVSHLSRLMELLRRDSSEEVRAAAAIALGHFAMLAELEELRPAHGEAVSHALLTAFNDRREHLEVRCRALEAIAPMSSPEVVKIIHEAHLSGDGKLKASAIYAMGQNCDPVWLPLLREELKSPDPEIRFEAAGACGECGDEEAVPFLVPLLEDSDIQVRLAAIESLGRIGGTRARAALRRCSKDEDSDICQAAADALEEMKAAEGGFLLDQS
jgi:HEAT repeat protein